MTIPELIIAVKKATGYSDEALAAEMRARGVHVSTQSVLLWRQIIAGKPKRNPQPNAREMITNTLIRIIEDAKDV